MLLQTPAMASGQSAVEGVSPFGAAPGTPASRAEALVREGDTTRALALLDSAVRKNPRDAVAWYYQGMYLWSKTGHSMRPSVFPSQEMVRMVSAADSSLRLAVNYAPDSARYFVSLGQFTLKSGYSIVRAAGRLQVNGAIEAAKRSGDIATLAVASDIAGMYAWRDYEFLGNRAILIDGRYGQRPVLLAPTSRNTVDHEPRWLVNKVEPPTGLAPYSTALSFFQAAVGADSSNQRYSRHLYMALAAKNRWEELLSVATQRSAQFAFDYQAKLARGLSLHRLRRFAEAKAAFDSASILMEEDEWERLTRFSRLLTPKSYDTRSTKMDSSQFASMPEGQRRGLAEMYWLLNDPLSLTAENELQLEFLARVVYADMRWTDEERGLRGADTDRGDIHVRYGPPVQEVTSECINCILPAVTLLWDYPDRTFLFELVPSFNTAYFPWGMRDRMLRDIDNEPALFNNIPTTALIDTIPVRIARFRAAGDSLDAVIAARVPLDSLVRTAPLDRVPIDYSVRIFDQFVRVQGAETSRRSYSPDSAGAAELREFTRRLGPGINVVRIEALQADTRRAARATVRLTPQSTTGFAMSDVLFGSKPTTAAGTTASRWTDVNTVPGDGVYDVGAPIGLVWELYELTAAEGASRYNVTISVNRVGRRGALGFTLRALDGLGRAVGRAGETNGNIVISFDRTAKAAPALVEFLSLDMGQAPRGRFALRIDITDRGSGQRVSRETEFTVR